MNLSEYARLISGDILSQLGAIGVAIAIALRLAGRGISKRGIRSGRND